MRVKSYSQGDIIVTLIAVSTMNKGLEAFYEGMRVKMRSTFIWWKARLHDGKKKKKFKIKFVVLNLTLYICTIQLAPEGVAGIFLEKRRLPNVSFSLESRKVKVCKLIRQRRTSTIDVIKHYAVHIVPYISSRRGLAALLILTDGQCESQRLG